MKNTVRVSAAFSFKGETHSPSIVLDLDQFLDQNRRLEDLYPLLAKEGGFDPYSYEYEMLLSAPLVFDQPQGLAESAVIDGQLDFDKLRQTWQEQNTLNRLRQIAHEHMGVHSLEDLPGLKETLLSVYAMKKHHSP
ncbi:hypothetical protein [Thiolapillus sp.]